MIRGVVDEEYDPLVPQVGRERLLHPTGLALARLLLGVLRALQGVRVDGRGDQVDDCEDVQQGLAVPRPDHRPMPLHPERRGQRRDHRESCLVLFQQHEFPGVRPFVRSAISSLAFAWLGRRGGTGTTSSRQRTSGCYTWSSGSFGYPSRETSTGPRGRGQRVSERAKNRIDRLVASGSSGQWRISSSRSWSKMSSAPDSAPLSSRSACFPGVFAVGWSPVSPTFPLPTSPSP